MIKIVGMGAESGDLTESAIRAIQDADTVFVKTERHPGAKYIISIAKNTVFLDSVYEVAEDFEALNQMIAEKIISDGGEKKVYCVAGSGVADRSVRLLQQSTECALIPGVSIGERSIFVSKATEYIYLSATEFCERARNLFDTNFTLVLTECNDPYLAADVKLKLLDIYGAEQPLFVGAEKITIKELDRVKKFDDGTVLVIPPIPLVEKERCTFGDLIEVIYRLRDPDGCQWDRAQTHATIRGNAIEEAYELVEAIDLDDIDKMREESGDVVLQGLFNAVIADGTGEFNVNDMITELTRKLVTRHTHIFGENRANNADDALRFWEAAKAIEKGYHSVSDKLDSIPKTFSALMSAWKAQKISAKIGFDFNDAESAAKKVPEELAEFLCETDFNRKEMEGGDLLFAAVNVLRLSGVEPELALLRATKKYVGRVKRVSQLLEKENKTLKDLNPSEFDAVWAAAKAFKKE